MRVLLATTTGWNPGDDFIRMGVEWILERRFGESGICAHYDKSPDAQNLLRRHRVTANAFHPFRHRTLAPFDRIVVAGTPDWCGPSTAPLYMLALKERRTIDFIGIGSEFLYTLDMVEKEVLAKATTVICRDELTHQLCLAYNPKAVLLPCPAMFAFAFCGAGSTDSLMGVVYQGTHGNEMHATDPVTSATLLALAQTSGASIIVHYIDELFEVQASGFTGKVFYCADPVCYQSIYRRFDRIVSHRLHGAIAANSLRIPVILTNGNMRCRGAAKLFPGINVQSMLDPGEHDWGLKFPVLSFAEWAEFEDKTIRAYEEAVA